MSIHYLSRTKVVSWFFSCVTVAINSLAHICQVLQENDYNENEVHNTFLAPFALLFKPGLNLSYWVWRQMLLASNYSGGSVISKSLIST